MAKLLAATGAGGRRKQRGSASRRVGWLADVAAAVEFLIANGHRAAEVWAYTPRQVSAFLRIAGDRRKQELAELLSIQTLAARGEAAAIKRQMRELGAAADG